MAELNTRRRGNKWEYRFEGAKVGGERKQFSKGGFRTKKEALEAGNKALAEYNMTGQLFTPSEISFSDYIDLWLKKYCYVNLNNVTCCGYQKKIDNIIRPVLGKHKLKSINSGVLQQFINDKFNEGYSRNTLVLLKGILSGSLRYAVEPLHLIQYNPMINVRLPAPRAKAKVPTRQAPNEYISAENIKRILERYPENSTAHIPLILGYRCGLRIGEAFAVCWEDIDLDKKVLMVNRQLQWDEKIKKWYFALPKYESVREVDIDDETFELLLRTKEKQKANMKYYDEYYVYLYEDENHFINKEKKGREVHFINTRECGDFISPRIMQHTSSTIHKELGIESFHFHGLRHTHCSILIENRVPINYIQKRLGHKNVQVTWNVYSHLTENMKNEATAIIKNLFTSE